MHATATDEGELMTDQLVNRDHLKQARGVLPFPTQDPVLPNPHATGQFLFVTLRPDLDVPGVRDFLTSVNEATRQLREQKSGPDRVATVATGFSGTFFTRPDGTQRFDGIGQVPAGLKVPPLVANSQSVPADMVSYVVSTSEGCAARFIAHISMHPAVTAVDLERGYQRLDRDEPFGYRDGVRNIEEKKDRRGVVFIDRDDLPEEPWWAHDGTYLAYLKVEQDVTAMAAKPAAEQDAIIGRDRNGRRLDHAPGSEPTARAEGSFTDPLVPPVDSHVRKSGPRGAAQDTVRIFRRGLPYFEVGADGRLAQGLQFASFQASLDAFDVVFNRWMTNPSFPPGVPTGPDRLLRVVTVRRHGFFFIPPEVTGRPLGEVMFLPEPATRKPKTGKVAVRKTLRDAATGDAHRGELSGFTFALLEPTTSALVGAPFTTDGLGHALSDDVALGTYTLREVATAGGVSAAPDQTVMLSSAREVVRVENTVPAGTVY